jgi:hypothetical protein
MCIGGEGVQQPSCSMMLHVLVEILACLVVSTHREMQQSDRRYENYTIERTLLLTQFVPHNLTEQLVLN